MEKRREEKKRAVLLILTICLFAYLIHLKTSRKEMHEVREDKVPILYQTDLKWKDEKYGDSTIGEAGCAPTALAMAFGMDDPREIVAYSENHGHYVEGIGTAWTLIEEAAAAYNHTAYELGLDQNEVDSVLAQNGTVILNVKPGQFTTTGHFLLLAGKDENGYILHDPNSKNNTSRYWNWKEFEQDIVILWAVIN